MRSDWWAAAIGALAGAIAIGFAASASGLIDDDAYTFLRYAEHLAAGEGLAFNTGEPSAGITSILWVLLLAGARWLTGAELILIAQAMGALCFGAALALMVRTVESNGQPPALARLAGIVAALSPVFICQAISGMEVGLNMLLVAAAIAGMGRRLTATTVATGLAVATRPDNVLLAPLVVLFQPGKRWRTSAAVAIGIALCALPWAAYCYDSGGTLLPPTRTGKLLVFLPGWYGVTLEQFSAMSWAERAGFSARALYRAAMLFSEGQARVLLPWLALVPFGLSQMAPRLIAPLVLLLLSAVTYAIEFPLVKLRYFVHLLPWLIPVALAGLFRVVDRRARHSGGGRSRPRLALWMAIVVLHLALCVRALPRYRNWVACEGVKTAAGQWLATHTAPSARLALEPIGAIGYHSRRYIIDIGGLLAADVWPVIRRGPGFEPDELLGYLRRRRANYLVDTVDGPWAGRLLATRPGALQQQATINGPPGCAILSVYSLE
ncbi:MAG: hypothetical protein HY699_11575 [Deltaproteobacteria bacterium]|nr:hypothetical protein [Deltaproteobacteria bacterium]